MKYLSMFLMLAAPLLAQQYDVVLSGGRVMDPESGLDAVRNVGITGGRIAAISASPLNGRTVVDVKGLVVAPGFIDLHVHKHSPEVYGFKARDGVTTALELEFGVWPVKPWYAQRQDRSLINFGATSSHIAATMSVMRDPGSFAPGEATANRTATAAEVRQIREHVRQGLDDGALGI